MTGLTKRKAAVLMNTCYQVQQPESSFFPWDFLYGTFFLPFPEQTLNMPGKGSKLKGAISFGWPARALGARRMLEDGARQTEQHILLADITGTRFSTASPLHLCPCSAASPWPLVPLQHLVCQMRSSFVGISQKMQQ